MTAPGQISGVQQQTDSQQVLLRTNAQNELHNEIETVRTGCAPTGGQGAAGGQAVAIVYEGATLPNVKPFLSALEGGVWKKNLFGFMIDREKKEKHVGEFILVRAKKEFGVFTFQFTFQKFSPPDSALIVLEQWFCWDDFVYVQNVERLDNDTKELDICFFSSGVQ